MMNPKQVVAARTARLVAEARKPAFSTRTGDRTPAQRDAARRPLPEDFYPAGPYCTDCDAEHWGEHVV